MEATAPASSTAYAKPGHDRLSYTLDRRWLLAVYLVVPVSMLFILIDSQLLDHRLSLSLPDGASRSWLWPLLLGLPHIFASMVTLADRAYLRTYRWQLGKPALMMLALSVIGLAGPAPLPILLWLYFIVTTTAHTVGQQLGLTAHVLAGPMPKALKVWKVASTVMATCVYALLFAPGSFIHSGAYLTPFGALLVGLMWLAMLVAIACAILTLRLARTRIARAMVLANLALQISVLLAYLLDYAFLAAMMPRLVHDLTAYAVYVVHDLNRNRDRRLGGAPNFIHRGLARVHCPIWLVTPLVSVAIAWCCNRYMHLMPVLVLTLTLTLLHYRMEKFIWRKGSPHRGSFEFS